MAEDDGVHIVIDEDQHRPLAECCCVMLGRLQERYEARDNRYNVR